jgi:hypothetical protein
LRLRTQGRERTITTHSGRRRSGHRAVANCALLGASGSAHPGVHHRSPGGRSNRHAREGPGCYPSVTPRPRAGRLSTTSSGIPASVGNPPVLRSCSVEQDVGVEASVSTATRQLGPGRKLRSRHSRSRLTWSFVKAIGKGPGPQEGVSPRTRPCRIPGLPGASRTQVHPGGPRPGSTEEIAGN